MGRHADVAGSSVVPRALANLAGGGGGAPRLNAHPVLTVGFRCAFSGAVFIGRSSPGHVDGAGRRCRPRPSRKMAATGWRASGAGNLASAAWADPRVRDAGFGASATRADGGAA
jgi:hypothetical protein